MTRIALSSIQTSVLPALNSCWREAAFLADPLAYARRTRLVLNTNEKNYFYLLDEGRVALSQDIENGKIRTISIMERGTLLNITHALARPLTEFIESGCYFDCLTDVRLYRFDGSLLQDVDFIKKYPHLIVNLMGSLSIKILAQHSCVAYFGSGTAQTRLCRFCLQLSRANGYACDFSPGLSQTRIAHLLGMNRATLVRMLKKFRQMGIILEMTSERMVIGDLRRLEALAMQ